MNKQLKPEPPEAELNAAAYAFDTMSYGQRKEFLREFLQRYAGHPDHPRPCDNCGSTRGSEDYDGVQRCVVCRDTVPDQPQALTDEELRKQFDDIMEDLAFGHNFDYAAKAIWDLFGLQRQAWEREAEKRGVAWSVSVIDEMHFDDNSTAGDRTYKGIKNTIRDRYKSVTGIDPAPEYPVKAKLTSAKEKQFDENIT